MVVVLIVNLCFNHQKQVMMVGFNKDNQHTQPFQPLIQQQCKQPNKVVPRNSKGFSKGNQTSMALFWENKNWM
jgi:hypothetical protein